MRQAFNRGLYTQNYRENPTSNSNASIMGFGIFLGFRLESPPGVPVDVPLFLEAARLQGCQPCERRAQIISFFYFSGKSALHDGDDTWT